MLDMGFSFGGGSVEVPVPADLDSDRAIAGVDPDAERLRGVVRSGGPGERQQRQ
jgi:hypothetical protein